MAYDIQISATPLKLDLVPIKTSAGTIYSGNNVQTYQNVTPSEQEFKNQTPGFGDDSPYSSRTYNSAAGSIGKQTEVDAPQDLSRSYLCDLDNSRSGVLAPRLTWPNNSGNVQFAATAGGSTRLAGSSMLPVESATQGAGVIVTTTGGSDAARWLYFYSASSRQYVSYRALPTYAPEPYAVQNTAGVRVPSFECAAVETNGHLWIPAGNTHFGAPGGAFDALVNTTPVLTGTNFLYFVALGGYVFSFEWASTATGIVLSLRNAATLAVLTPTTLAGIDAAPELGNQPIQQPVPDVVAVYKPVVFNGAIYFCSDRAVYKAVFDEQDCRILVTTIHSTFTRITGQPAIYQGSLFVPAGNVLQRWTPGQTEFTPVPIDDFGKLPATMGGGTIVCTLATSMGLLLAVISDPTSGADATLIRMDQNGVFAILDCVISGSTGVVRTNDMLLVSFVDAGYTASTPIVGVLCRNSGDVRVIAIRESNQDPSQLAAGQRLQVSGSHFECSAWDVGGVYNDRKDMLRLLADCADVSSAQKIRIYYQTDYEDKQADSMDSGNGGYAGTISTTIMANQGRWHVAFILDNTTTGLTLVGGGYTGYAEKSLTALTLQYRRVRWMVEMIGDTSGTLYPRLYGFRFTYSETPSMYVVWSVRVRILCDDPDLQDPGLTTPPPHTPADVYAIWSTLWGYAKAGTFVAFQDINGDTRVVKITKFIYNGVDYLENGNPGGAPTLTFRRIRKLLLTLALQEADPAA